MGRGISWPLMFDWDGGKRRAAHVSFLPSVLFGMLADVGRWWERNYKFKRQIRKDPERKENRHPF